MALPSPESIRQLLETGEGLGQRILSIAKRLEALQEYSPDQALIVAADIVRARLGLEENGLESTINTNTLKGAAT